MRYGEAGVSNDFISIKYDVDVESARALGSVPAPVIFFFDLQACLQQVARRKNRIAFYCGIEEPGLIQDFPWLGRVK